MQLKVYYLDDEPDVCEVFKENFNTANIDITTFTNPPAAYEIIHKSPPDLLFLDYRMPNTNGDKFAKSLTINIPVVLLTGDLGIKTETKFEKIYNKQPFPWEEIEQFLNQQLQMKLKKVV